MSIIKRIITIILIISLQGCGVGAQGLLGNVGNQAKVTIPAVGPSMSKSIEKDDQARLKVEEIPTRKLDIVIPTFDAGLTEENPSDTPIWVELRRAEANLFAVELKKALEQTEKFSAVRVTPDRSATASIYVMGRIAQSKGHHVEIDLAVADISGLDLIAQKEKFNFGKPKPKLYNMFKTKSFDHNVDENFFKSPRNKGKNPYQPVFTEAAAYVVDLLNKHDDERVRNLNKLSTMRFAASFSEDAFAEYMEIDKGRIVLTGLPNNEDSMYRKVQAIRVRDQLFVDNLQNDYEHFAQKIEPSHRLWQEQTLAEHQAQRKAKEDATKAAVGAALMLGLAIAAGQSAYDNNYDPIGDSIAATAMVGAGAMGIGLIGDAIKSSEEAKMHNELIAELGDSIEIEIAPKVVAFEEKEKELVGNAKEQFAQWRAFLKTIYELEKTPAKTL